MLPCVYPPTYSNSMHFIPAYLVKEHLVGSYVGDYTTNEPTVRDSAKEYHHADFYNSLCIDPTVSTWTGEWQLPVPKSSTGEQTSNVIVAKEVYVNDIIKNAYKVKTKSQNATATALGPYVLHRTYLRSLKKKKYKSFMVRDIIDVSADERQSDASDANMQCQNIQPRTKLSSPPPPEPEIACKNYEFYSDYRRPEYYEQAGLYSKDSRYTLADNVEPSPSNPGCDSLQSRLEQLLDKTPSSSSDSITCESSGRTTNSPDSLESHSESCAGDSGVSPYAKSKRTRTIFSCSQLERLETEFERTHYMVGSERSQLAAELNLSESQVKVWFQNRRIKQRKQFHEQQQAILSKIKKSQDDDSQAEQETESKEDNAPSTTLCENSSC